MKAAALIKAGSLVTGEGKVGLVDVPVPEVGPEEVLVKVAYCSICGSDNHAATIAALSGASLPFRIGHEVSGTIVKLGANANKKGLKVGDRVAGNFMKFCGTCYYCLNGQEQFCDYKVPTFGMSEYVVWHEAQVNKLPDSVSLEEGCLAEPVAISLRAIERAEIKTGMKVAVFGAGGIGLLVTQLAKISGAASVTIVEPVEEKLELARKLGADYAINPRTDDVIAKAMEITDNIGFAAVVESSGAPAATKPALEVVAKGGTVVYLSMYPTDYEFPVNLFKHAYQREVTIRGMFLAPYSFPRAIAILPRLNLKDMIQKTFTLDEVEEAFEAQLSGKYAKVVVKCS